MDGESSQNCFDLRFVPHVKFAHLILLQKMTIKLIVPPASGMGYLSRLASRGGTAGLLTVAAPQVSTGKMTTAINTCIMNEIHILTALLFVGLSYLYVASTSCYQDISRTVKHVNQAINLRFTHYIANH